MRRRPTEPESRPHVLLVMVDQWPGRFLGAAGHPVLADPDDRPACAQRRALHARLSRMPDLHPGAAHADDRHDHAHPWRPRVRHGQPHACAADHRAVLQERRLSGVRRGKLHVYPPRDRIGFDDVLLAEEGRPHLGTVDDHDLYLADRGFAGQQFMHGMNNNNYMFRTHRTILVFSG